MRGASPRPAQPWRAPPPAAPLGADKTISASVFQAPQSAHWPCHLFELAPQSLQT
jgi:hypothetical protein